MTAYLFLLGVLIIIAVSAVFFGSAYQKASAVYFGK